MAESEEELKSLLMKANEEKAGGNPKFSAQGDRRWLFLLSLSCVQLLVIPWTAALRASLSFTISTICSNSCPLNQ